MRAYRTNTLLLERPIPDAIREELKRRGYVRWKKIAEEKRWRTKPDGSKVFEEVRYEQKFAMNFVTILPGFISVPRYLFSDSALYMAGYTEIIEAPYPDRLPHYEQRPNGTLRPGGQSDAFQLALVKEHGSIVLGPGRGKTFLAGMIAAHFGQPWAAVVDEEGLAHQWMDMGRKLLGLHDEDIGLVKGKNRLKNFRGKAMTVLMSRTICAALKGGWLPPDMHNAFGCVFFDEAHKMWTHKTGTPVLGAFNARRYALTATPHDDDRKRIMTAHCGNVLIEDRKPEMTPICFFHGISAKDAPERYRTTKNYTKINSYFLGNNRSAPEPTYLEEAEKLLRSLLDRERVTFVLIERKRFAHELRKRIGEEFVGVIEGDIPGEMRQRILKSFPIVFAIRSIGEQALNNPAIDAVVLAMPFGRDKSGKASAKSMQQGVGRGLRLMQGKANCELHVLYPDTTYGKHLATGVEERCEQYEWVVQKGIPKRDARDRRVTYDKKRRASAREALRNMKRFL